MPGVRHLPPPYKHDGTSAAGSGPGTTFGRGSLFVPTRVQNMPRELKRPSPKRPHPRLRPTLEPPSGVACCSYAAEQRPLALKTPVDVIQLTAVLESSSPPRSLGCTRSGRWFARAEDRPGDKMPRGTALDAPAHFDAGQYLAEALANEDVLDSEDEEEEGGQIREHEGFDGAKRGRDEGRDGAKGRDRDDEDEDDYVKKPRELPPCRPDVVSKNRWRNWCRSKRRAVVREDARKKSQDGLKAYTRKHLSRAAVNPLRPLFDISGARVATKTSWTATRGPREELREWGLQELLQDHGMTLIDWDGRTSRTIVSENKVIGVLAGMPAATDWNSVINGRACQVIERARHLVDLDFDEVHRRGAFSSVRRGLSHGGGQRRPKMLQNTRHNTPVVEQLFKEPAFERIAGFTNSVFRANAPQLYNYYADTIDKLADWSLDDVGPIYPRSVFAAATINLGPRTVTFPHRDYANLSWGWCAITALGDYDPKKGGHLVLWDLGYVICFPPGATVLIPSAMIRHSNTSVGQHEHRYSFAQYSAGALFRWIDNGYQTQEEWERRASPSMVQDREHQRAQRLNVGLSMYKTCA